MTVQQQFNQAVSEQASKKIYDFIAKLDQAIPTAIEASATKGDPASLWLIIGKHSTYAHVADTEAYKALHAYCAQPDVYCAIKYMVYPSDGLNISLDFTQTYDQSQDYKAMQPKLAAPNAAEPLLLEQKSPLAMPALADTGPTGKTKEKPKRFWSTILGGK